MAVYYYCGSVGFPLGAALHCRKAFPLLQKLYTRCIQKYRLTTESPL